jgi:hypothetical protein
MKQKDTSQDYHSAMSEKSKERDIIDMMMVYFTDKVKKADKEQRKQSPSSERYAALTIYKSDMQEAKMFLQQQINILDNSDKGLPTLSMVDTMLYKRIHNLVNVPKVKRDEDKFKDKLVRKALKQRYSNNKNNG